MRTPFLFALLLACGGMHAGTCRIDLQAPGYAGEPVVLYLFSDLITDRLVMVTQGRIDAHGDARLEAVVTGTVKARLRVNIRHCDIFLRPDAHYTIRLPYVEGDATTINGTMELVPEFQDLDLLDVNALVSDLNTRLDAFLADGLATDQEGGMNAADRVRSAQKDSLGHEGRPTTLFVMPTPSQQRIDTFETKLRRFYAEVKDPWFWHYLDYAVAGLRIGPQGDMPVLYDRYIKDRPIAYDDPEQLRFLQNFFGDYLMTQVFRRHDDRLKAHVKAAATDSVMALLAGHDLLRPDPRLCELVMIMELYADYYGKTFDRKGVREILAHVRDEAAFTEHRVIADNMLWDLTMMSNGSIFPSLELRDLHGQVAALDDLLQGPVCIAVTAAWCTYCDVEMGALEELHAEYGDHVRFVVIGIDSTLTEFTRYAWARPERNWLWLWAGDDPLFMDRLRLRNVPAFFLLNDREIALNPAPLPSAGMAEIFFKLKTEAEEKNKIHFGTEPPPPRR